MSTFGKTVIKSPVKSFIEFGVVHLINELGEKFCVMNAVINVAEQ